MKINLKDLNISIAVLLILLLLLYSGCDNQNEEISQDTPYVWLIGEATVLHSIDAGLTWEDYITDNSDFLTSIVEQSTFRAIAFYNSVIGGIVGEGGIYAKTLDASTWRPWIDPYYFNNFTSIAMADEKLVFFTSEDGGIYNSENKRIYSQPVEYKSIYFINSLKGWATGTNGKISRTEDSGDTWSTQISNISNSLNSIYFTINEADTIGYIAGSEGIILKSENNGNSWITLNSGITTGLNCIYFVNASIGFCAGLNGVILKTTDGGTSWVELNSTTTNNLTSISFMNEYIGIAVGMSGTILRTTDGGKTWISNDFAGDNDLYGVNFVKRKISLNK